jgi:hypothetical protein
MAREKLFNMRMSAEEWARAERVAEHHALNVASLVRMLLKQADDGIVRPELRSARFARVPDRPRERSRAGARTKHPAPGLIEILTGKAEYARTHYPLLKRIQCLEEELSDAKEERDALRRANEDLTNKMCSGLTKP